MHLVSDLSVQIVEGVALRPSSRAFGTGVRVFFPTTHDWHLVGTVEESNDIPVAMSF